MDQNPAFGLYTSLGSFGLSKLQYVLIGMEGPQPIIKLGVAKQKMTIDNNTFSGNKATVGAGSGLEAGGTFMGTFSGGFYGDKAAEAGGVFDFTSDGATAGEFLGAFGGDRK